MDTDAVASAAVSAEAPQPARARTIHTASTAAAHRLPRFMVIPSFFLFHPRSSILLFI